MQRGRLPTRSGRTSPCLRAVQIANHLTGMPYRWGGASPRAGFDCSGLLIAGGGKVIHAPRSGTTVRWDRLSSHGGYYGARRLVAA